MEHLKPFLQDVCGYKKTCVYTEATQAFIFSCEFDLVRLLNWIELNPRIGLSLIEFDWNSVEYLGLIDYAGNASKKILLTWPWIWIWVCEDDNDHVNNIKYNHGKKIKFKGQVDVLLLKHMT